MRLKSAGKAPRHKLWSKDQFLSDLRKFREIGKVCEIYLLKGQKVGALRSDVWRWRKADAEYDKQVREVLAGEGTDRPNAGRPPLDGGDKAWQETYCVALVEKKLALDRAAAVTPYSVRQIEDFLDPACSSYDQEFAKMVRGAELVLASRVREGLVDLLHEDNWSDFDRSKMSQSKAWFYLKMAEKLEPSKWGRRQLEVSGVIDHRHQHRYLPPGEKIAMLVDDRNRFMAARMAEVKALPSGESVTAEIDKEEIYEAEVIADT